MRIIGIDPGKKGYAVLTDSKKNVFDFFNFDFGPNNEINPLTRELFEKWQPDFFVLEKVMGRGGWGATQNFTLGFVSGQLHALIQIRPHLFITPQTWQGQICKSISRSVKSKERTLAAYRSLFPSDPLQITKAKKTINDNLIDAFLISIYGQMTYSKLDSFIFNREIIHG